MNVAQTKNLTEILNFMQTQVEASEAKKCHLIEFKKEKEFKDGIMFTGSYVLDYQYITAAKRTPTTLKIGYKDGNAYVLIDSSDYSNNYAYKRYEEFVLTDLKSVKQLIRTLNRKKNNYELTDYFTRFQFRCGVLKALSELITGQLNPEYSIGIFDVITSKNIISVIQPVNTIQDGIFKFSFCTEKNSEQMYAMNVTANLKTGTILKKSFIDPLNLISDKDIPDDELISLLIKYAH